MGWSGDVMSWGVNKVKLAVFDKQIPGVILNDHIIDISPVLAPRPLFNHRDPLLGLIEEWPALQDQLTDFLSKKAGVPIASVRLRPPLTRPSKILCAAANYMEGLEGNVSELEFFHKSPSAIIGDGDTMVLPSVELTIVHHELELGVVIGRSTRNATLNNAMASVFGYTIFEDGSARGITRNGQMTFFDQKSCDTFAPIGPVIVTADEIPDPHNLQVRLWANGELRQDYNTSDMAHRVPSLIVQASAVNTLLPGDIIATGCNRQGLGPLQNGDEIVQEITGIGRLTNRVSDPLRRSWPYGIDAEFAEWVLKPRAQRGKMGPPRIVPAVSRR